MEALLIIFAVFVGIPALKRAWFGWRFDELRREYLARWSVLDRAGRVDFLYAEKGLRIQQISAEGDGVIAGQQDSDRRALDLDICLDDLDRVEASIETYENLTDAELLERFHGLIRSHWIAMCAVADYDFPGTRVELNHLFENRVSLASRARVRQGVASQRESIAKS